jgi:phosphatidylserine/phosphatidylglycerophosphate/cardiolipin synthase-like enzyme
MLEIIKSPWEKTFLSLLKGAKTSVYLASPFIKQQTARLIVKSTRRDIDFRYINSFKLSNFHRGASDLEALRILSNNKFRQKNVHNLHAKFFIFDNIAVITSGNLTPGGLRNNLEYGVLLRDEIVDKIKDDYIRIFDNPEYPEITLDIINKAQDILNSVPLEKRKKIKVTEKTLFEEVLNDENIEEMFDGGIDSIRVNLTSWKKDVFECLLKLKNDVFSLEEVYSFEKELTQLHPRNQNIKAKIRQQLQYLRNIGLVEFIKPGLYKKLWA